MGDEGRECMKYLSRNEAKAIYVESVEERLVLKLRELIEAQDKENAQIKAAKDKKIQAAPVKTQSTHQLESIRQWATVTHSSYSRVFGSNKAAEALPSLLRLGPHIRNAPWMRVSWLGDLFSGTHGGVSTVKLSKSNIIDIDVV
jgi:hypothetical protein